MQHTHESSFQRRLNHKKCEKHLKQNIKFRIAILVANLVKSNHSNLSKVFRSNQNQDGNTFNSKSIKTIPTIIQNSFIEKKKKKIQGHILLFDKINRKYTKYFQSILKSHKTCFLIRKHLKHPKQIQLVSNGTKHIFKDPKHTINHL